ncbi:hypothetical protein JD844_013648 [Phrynosoma platyrhinos]|uniref:Uncharacterized protein n=1 Tax=Phrynosoma platyrhinos TaxID=52577 RepID=A0ABQ7TL73_PHRPL|nr:hypothetical protein JD844_013648 [Phrynosoma platyrhinos]
MPRDEMPWGISQSRVCARNLLRIPLIYNETYAKPQHQPYLKMCPGPRLQLVFQLYSHFSLIPFLLGQALGIQETIPNEIQELQAKVEKLEEKKLALKCPFPVCPQRLERAISVLPSPLEPTQLKELWSRLQYLDQVESLSDQLLFLEEKLGDCEYPKDHAIYLSCACQNGKNGFGYDIAR